jgi:hypothetical protein
MLHKALLSDFPRHIGYVHRMPIQGRYESPDTCYVEHVRPRDWELARLYPFNSNAIEGGDIRYAIFSF